MVTRALSLVCEVALIVVTIILHGMTTHNIIQIHSNVMRDSHYYVEYSPFQYEDREYSA